MNTIYYFNFNNYTNRVVKGFATLTEYIQNAEYIGKSNTVNFNKTNDLEANVVCYLDNYKSPDYALLCEEDTIVSRWFVISETRGNKNNYQLNLKRDIVYDNLELILNNENTLVKRGYAKDTETAILNDEEPFSFNEYKRKEEVLDYSYSSQNGGWLAFFIGNKNNAKIAFSTHSKTSGAYFLDSGNCTMPTSKSYKTDEKTKENETVLYAGTRGYSMVLVPAILFTEYNNYVDYKIMLANASTVIENLVVLNEVGIEVTVPLGETVYTLMEQITNNIISNTGTFLDAQIIPEVKGFDYTIDIDNRVITINRFSAMDKFANILFADSTSGGVEACLLPVSDEVEFSYTSTFNLSDLVKNYDANASKKLLECYKFYLESPDRSTSAKIDLRKFIKKDTGAIVADYISFTTKMLYQPFQSYMYVYPYKSGTYYNLNKEDGQYLLCGYNNQILRTSDAWINYLLNNKNYLNSFNLQVRDAKINAVSGAVSTGIKGATTGAMLGGGVGAVALGATSAIASGIESYMNISEMKQNFKWSCDNLQSQPQSVSKVSTFTPMNTIYPILSVYYNDEVIADDCKLFKNYLKMNGFTINKIDTIKNHYTQDYQYVSAEIIRLDDFKGTATELQEIQNEISRGLFFQE